MKRFTREFLVEEIRKCAKNLGRVPKSTEFKYYLYCKIEFGTWRNAIESAGLKYKNPINENDLNEEELLNEIKDVYNKLQRTPRHYDLPHYRQIKARFGSFDIALQKSGVKIDSGRSCLYTDEELLNILKEKAKELGRTPLKREISQGDTIKNHFGTWNNALKLAGLSVNLQVMNLSEEYLLQYLKEKCKELGRVPKALELEHYSAINRRFGGIGKAINLLISKS